MYQRDAVIVPWPITNSTFANLDCKVLLIGFSNTNRFLIQLVTHVLEIRDDAQKLPKLHILRSVEHFSFYDNVDTIPEKNLKA